MARKRLSRFAGKDVELSVATTDIGVPALVMPAATYTPGQGDRVAH